MIGEMHYLSITECVMVFNEIKPWAGKWLTRSGIGSPLKLAQWAKLENAFVARSGHDYIVIVTNWYPGLKATIHPLFRNKDLIHNIDMLKTELEALRKLLDVIRIQVGVGSKAGNTIRHLCAKLGFEYEGTARKANRLGDDTLEDLEMWSYIPEGAL